MRTIRLAVRGLARSPLFTTVAVLSLALGIGANTAIFSFFEQVVLRTLPVENPHELAYLYSEGPRLYSVSVDEPGGPSFSYPVFRELEQQQTPFVGLAAARAVGVDLSREGVTLRVQGRVVSGSYFQLLGVRPAIGRLIEPADDHASDAQPVAVLGYRYWQSRFGGDVGALNQTLLVNGTPMTVVGVAQKGFASERQGTPPDIYFPLAIYAELFPFAPDLSSRREDWLTMFGRLKPGVRLERAEAEINVPFRAQLEIDLQSVNGGDNDFSTAYRSRTVTLKPGQHGRGELRDQSGKPLLLMMGMTLLVLLLACANVANLQLARGAARLREAAVRLAMGASRPQLTREFLVESLLLAAAGGAAGLVVARLATGAILASTPPSRGFDGYVSAELDWAALLFCLGLSLLSGVGFGLFPALRISRVSVASSLKDQSGQTTLTKSANGFRKTLVAAQVAITLLLLITSGLLVTTLVNLTRVDLGFRTDHLATFGVFPRMSGYSDDQIAQLHETLTERLAALPGALLVSSAQTASVANQEIMAGFEIEGYAPENGDSPRALINLTGADYFRTMGIPLVAGREFTPADNAVGSKVAIVNEAFARKFFPGRNPLGAHLERKGSWRIVGVVKDAAYETIRETAAPIFYLPLRQADSGAGLQFYVRTATSPENILPALQREVAAVDPTLAVLGLKTMEMQLEENTYAERILSVLTSAFAGLAVLLAAMGLYGVLAYSVTRRRREIGIRMALGAESAHVRGLVAREVAAVMLIGTTAGLALAAAAARSFEAFLFGLEPWDVMTYVAAAAVLWSTALAAAYLPTRRALRINPITALRYE